MTCFRYLLVAALFTTTCISSLFAQTGVPPWQPIGRYDYAPIRESSGLVTSRQHEDVYWTLNDSGNPNALYATRRNGSLIREIRVSGAVNYDWEALAIDDAGNLWIGEIGNNSRRRTDLRLYVVPEPDPFQDTIATVTATYPYRYPEENVDAEGLFISGVVPYIISKEIGRAYLYRFTELNPDTSKIHTLQRVGKLSGGAYRITGASLSRDGTRLAACTYDALWIYHSDTKMPLADLIATEPWALTHDFGVEATAFDGKDLLLTSERRDIYLLPPAWYEQAWPLPLRTIVPVAIENVQAQNGILRVEPYRNADLNIDGTHLSLSSPNPNASLTWPIDVPRADRYTLSAVLVRGPQYGNLQLIIDGNPVGKPYDASAPKPIAGSLIPLGAPTLTKGTHDITLRIMGKPDAAQEYKLGLDSYHLQAASPFAHAYRVIGPFDKADPVAIDEPLPPETDLNLSGTYSGLDNRLLHWQPATAREDGFLNLMAALGPNVPRYAVAYALNYAYAKTDREANLLVGSDDEIAVWINGREVHRNNTSRGASPDTDIAPCQLKAGWNEVLCKIGQNGGGWGLFLRFNDPNNALKYAPKPE